MAVWQHLRLGNDFHVLYFHLIRRTINAFRNRKKELKLVFISVTTVLRLLFITSLVCQHSKRGYEGDQITINKGKMKTCVRVSCWVEYFSLASAALSVRPQRSCFVTHTYCVLALSMLYIKLTIYPTLL